MVDANYISTDESDALFDIIVESVAQISYMMSYQTSALMPRKLSKLYSVEALVGSLREARLAKGMSQRALSERAGIPQSQISRVESGEVDLQLSTLIELARTLDLDVQLVPRNALPAVSAVIKEAAERSDERRARSSLDELIENAQRVRHLVEDGKVLDEVVQSLALIRPLLQGQGPLRQIEEARSKLEFLIKSADGLPPKYQDRDVRSVIRSLRDLRGSLVHARPLDEPKPAYSLDDDEDDQP